MEDYADPYRGLRAECAARNVSLRDSVQSCLESLADLLTEDNPERLRNEIARFFTHLHCGNDSFNSLPHEERQHIDAIMIGIPPRRLFELLNDMGRIIEGISLIDMSASCIRSSFAENALPYRPNEVFSLLDQFSQIDLTKTDDSPRTYSKPLRVSTWHDLFVKAKYSENTSERWFRDWLKQQPPDVFRRKSKNSEISFCVEFLKEQGVPVPQ